VSNLSPVQQEQLLNIGAYLKGIRTDQGRDISEVATQIFIRPAILKALEAGEWELLPEPVFIRGFIRRYGDVLGVNGEELASQFEATPVSVLPDPKLARGGTDGVVDKQSKHSLKVVSKAEPLVRPARSTRNGSGLRVALGFGAIALIGGGIWAIVQWGDDILALLPERPTVVTAPPEPTSPEPIAPEPTSTPEPTASAAPDPEEPITISVSLSGDSWMQVTVDGEKAFEGILSTGTQETWTAKNELRVTAGNAGVVQLSFNGAEEQPMGAPGSVKRLTLTPETSPTTLLIN
jgi:cytoskeleton protein RodZ